MGLNEIFSKYFVPSNDDLSENKSICKECGGRCCKNMGCHIAPSELKEVTADFIIALMEESNSISIDWYEGNPLIEDDHSRCYYLRIKNVGSSMIDPSWGGRCSLLTPDGCPILFQYRPKGGRMLIPVDSLEEECLIGYSKEQCAIEWLPYQEELKKVYDHFDSPEKNVYSGFNPDGLIDFLLSIE